jgi:hypothetical protein
MVYLRVGALSVVGIAGAGFLCQPAGHIPGHQFTLPIEGSKFFTDDDDGMTSM